MNFERAYKMDYDNFKEIRNYLKNKFYSSDEDIKMLNELCNLNELEEYINSCTSQDFEIKEDYFIIYNF